MKEKENDLIKIEEALSDIFDEDLNIKLKEIFGVCPIELILLLIHEKRKRLDHEIC